MSPQCLTIVPSTERADGAGKADVVPNPQCLTIVPSTERAPPRRARILSAFRAFRERLGRIGRAYSRFDLAVVVNFRFHWVGIGFLLGGIGF